MVVRVVSQVAQFAAMVKDEAMGKRKWKDGAWDGEWEIAPKGDAAFALKMSFDEASVLQQNVSYLLATLGVDAIHVLPAGDGDNEGGAAVPGKPQPVFFHAADLTPPPPPAGSVPFTAAAAATGTVRPASAPASTAAAASSGAPKVRFCRAHWHSRRVCSPPLASRLSPLAAAACPPCQPRASSAWEIAPKSRRRPALDPSKEAHMTAGPTPPPPSSLAPSSCCPSLGSSPTRAAEPRVSDIRAQVSMMEYLEQHKVATTLNAAVNELASEQPADPYAWLASKMQALAKGGGAK